MGFDSVPPAPPMGFDSAPPAPPVWNTEPTPQAAPPAPPVFSFTDESVPNFLNGATPPPPSPIWISPAEESISFGQPESTIPPVPQFIAPAPSPTSPPLPTRIQVEPTSPINTAGSISTPAYGWDDGLADAPTPSWREVKQWSPIIQPRRRALGEPIKVIAITVPKGGTGKTSTSVNGAALLASTGKRVLYIDANAQQADGADLLGVPNSAPTIMNLTQGGAITRESAISSCTKIPGTENLWALLGPRDPRQANPLLLTPQVYCEALDALKNDFDYILIDGPIAEIFREIIELFILTRSDYILSAVTPDVKTVMNTYKWFTDTTGERFAGAAAYPADQVGWFLNRYEDDIAFDEDDARASLRRPNESEWRYLGKIPDLKSVRRAGNMNQIPDDPEYVSSLAEVLYNATGDELLRPLMAGKKNKRFSKNG